MKIKQNNELFKNARDKKGLTQEQLAEKLNFTCRHLQKLEAGDKNITLTTMLKMKKELDIKDKELLTWLHNEEKRINNSNM